MEGDAMFAYSDRDGFPSGESFLALCENLYNTFALRRQNIIANISCTCRACANVADLDLKIIAHYGSFKEIQVGPMRDISGADVILVHRMAKTDVAAGTGIRSYALFSDAAVAAMGIEAAMTPYAEEIEHFGAVSMKVIDLARAWDGFRAARPRAFLEEAEGILTLRHRYPVPPAVLWETVTSPAWKLRWLGMRTVDVDRPEGRIGPGSLYVCAHDDLAFRYHVTDWQPFDYFSTRMIDPVHEGLTVEETYALSATDGGTEFRFTVGPAACSPFHCFIHGRTPCSNSA
ncbi:DUF2652 domain-containing protein [Marinibaculum pumilum]|uniref:DUF2652 domain-containing protein n=1 Tax=Marinibaculum pumilum TaxID=1766165 RepID=A0ABV7L7R1_9PROT